jgi:hypothetical protein
MGSVPASESFLGLLREERSTAQLSLRTALVSSGAGHFAPETRSKTYGSLGRFSSAFAAAFRTGYSGF